MFKRIIFLAFLIFSLVPSSYVLAESDPTTVAGPKLYNPIEADNVPQLVNKVISGALGIVGALALLMFVYGGFMWMLSGGNDKMIEKGKTTLLWAAVGLVTIFMSYAIVHFVMESIGVK